MTHRFTVTGLEPGSQTVEKRGSEEALAREEAALALVAGASWAPALVAREPGLLVSSRMPGAPRPLAALHAGEAGALGAVLRAVHDTRRAGEGGLWWWAVPATTLAGYRAARVEDAEAALAGTAHAGLAARTAATSSEPDEGADPFRLLHGDLVQANIVWNGSAPALVDWEFCRMGDPAEDLAYLVEVNAVPADLVAALLRGYGPPAIDRRVDAWRGLAAADAAGWYLAEEMEAEAAPASGARRRAGGRPLTSGGPAPSGPGAVAEVDHAVAEAAFVQQLEPQVQIVGQGPLAASHDDRRDEQVALVDQSGRRTPGRRGRGRRR